jgi:hypothetical protein
MFHTLVSRGSSVSKVTDCYERDDTNRISGKGENFLLFKGMSRTDHGPTQHPPAGSRESLIRNKTPHKPIAPDRLHLHVVDLGQRDYFNFRYT